MQAFHKSFRVLYVKQLFTDSQETSFRVVVTFSGDTYLQVPVVWALQDFHWRQRRHALSWSGCRFAVSPQTQTVPAWHKKLKRQIIYFTFLVSKKEVIKLLYFDVHVKKIQIIQEPSYFCVIFISMYECIYIYICFFFDIY